MHDPEVAGLSKALALLAKGLPPAAPGRPELDLLQLHEGQAQPLVPVLFQPPQVRPGLQRLEPQRQGTASD